MKKIFLSLLVATQIFGAISTDKKYKLNQHMGSVGLQTQLGTLIDEGGQLGLVKDGHQAKTILVATYNFATLGGATTSGTSLGVTLPAKAIISRSWLDVVTAPLGSGASVGFYAENASDIKAATAVGSLTTGEIEGTSTGTAANMKKMTVASTVKYVISGGTLTAGKIKVFIEYVMGE